MFVCKKCAEKEKLEINWGFALISRGPCEMCGTTTDCADYHLAPLPPLPPVLSTLDVQGFFQERRLRRQTFKPVRSGRFYFDGYRLDELQISATLYCQRDVTELIELLTNAKYCFIK